MCVCVLAFHIYSDWVCPSSTSSIHLGIIAFRAFGRCKVIFFYLFKFIMQLQLSQALH